MRKHIFIFLFSLLGLCFPQSARAQFIGDVGLQTVNPLLANNATCTGGAQVFQVANIGQIGHQATAISTAASFTMEIDASDASGATYRISNPQISFNNGSTVSYIVQGNGYYPKVSVVVTCSNGQLFTLTYAGAQTGFNNVIGPPGGTPTNLSGLIGNVQGVIPQQQTGGGVFPVIGGALQPSVNGQFVTVGLDNFGVGSVSVPNLTSGTLTVGSVPAPSQSGELAIAFEGVSGDNAGGFPQINAPWTCVAGANCNGSGSPRVSLAVLRNPSKAQPFNRTWSNSAIATGDVDVISFVLVQSPTATARQGTATTTVGTSIATAFSSNTLAGSTLLEVAMCGTGAACTGVGVTDTQGHTWVQINTIAGDATNGVNAIFVFAATTVSTAAADTITVTTSTGAFGATGGQGIVEITGATPANLTTPSISIAADPLGNQVVSVDAQSPNKFVCNVTISTATTTQCQAAPTTFNGVPLRAYVTDIQVNTTTTGTASAVQLKTGTGANCGTGTANLSAITYSTVTAAAPALASFLGMHTPLIAPVQTEICVTQTGTPGTATVEVHGFFAP